MKLDLYRLAVLPLGALAISAGPAAAIDLTVVSWGGAYSQSQINAYHDPYMAQNPEVVIVHDESSAEAVAKLRGDE